jgi:S1/P1 Nuclease
MRKFTLIFTFIAVTLSLVTYSPAPTYSWGFFAHKLINKMAIFTLPPGMINFYKKNLDYISDHAVDPDKRRYGVVGEAERHYIDIDHYGKDAFKEVPKFWKAAVEKYTEDTLKAYGIVPWHIEKMVYRLQEAFKEEDVHRILQTSAELGHYIGDAHVPLHTTENYNGQMTNQKGIHGFWESRIPEIKSQDYDFFTGRAKYADKVIDRAWSYVKASNNAVDSVLGFERELNARYSPDRKYSVESRGNVNMRVYSEEYTTEYNSMLNGMVERRLRGAIIQVGCLWYTAWVNAGKPDLNKLLDKEVTADKKREMEAEELLWEKGKQDNKLKGKGHDD